MTDDQAVRQIQQWLRDRGRPIVVDGNWGPLTQHAWESESVIARTFSGLPPAPPPPVRSDTGLRRVIWHWTAGGYDPASSLAHYHFVIDGSGRVHPGTLAPEDNISTSDRRYTPHTLNANTGSIGVAVAAMAGAQERPFAWGRYPMLEAQIDALCRETARLCDRYGIPVGPRTTLSHAEVQPTLGIVQRGKWDISCLPGDKGIRSPLEVGGILRDRTSDYLAARAA